MSNRSTRTIDLVNSAVALGVKDIAKRKEKITLISGGGTFDLPARPAHRPARTGPMTWSLGKGIAEALPQLGKKWYFITADYAFGNALERGITNFITKAGGEVVGSVKHPFNTADFSSYLLQAAAANPDVIAFANAGDDLNNAIKQANEIPGIGKKNIKMATMSLDVDNIHGLGLPAAQGSMYVVGFYADLDDDTRAFAKRYRDKMGRSPGFIPAGVYSAVRHYLKAIEAAGTDHSQEGYRQDARYAGQ